MNKSKIKNIIKNVFVLFGGSTILRWINRTPRVLFYHSVDNIVNQEVESVAFRIENFEKQVEYLRKHYEIISLDDFYDRYTSNSFTNREIVLTFDDGYANNLYIVAPILKKYGIPFSVFISTEHIDTGEFYPTSIARIIILGSHLTKISIPLLNLEDEDISDLNRKRDVYKIVSKEIKNRPLHEVRIIISQLKDNISESEYILLQKKYKSDRPMTWDEVKQLHDMRVTIGSHCMYHMICHSNQRKEDLEEQIRGSKNIIETHLGAKCNYFVYPNGDYTEESNRFVKEAGYRMGFTVQSGRLDKNKNNMMALPRIAAPQNIETFKIIISLYPK